jgi:hypothetical protein
MTPAACPGKADDGMELLFCYCDQQANSAKWKKIDKLQIFGG